MRTKPHNGADGKPDIIRSAADELIKQDGVEVIVTAGTLATKICVEVTEKNKKSPPVVFASVGDPWISKLDQPQNGRWYTGGSNGQVTHVTQRVDFMLRKPGTFPAPYAVVGYYKDPNDDPATAAMQKAYNYLVATVGAGNVIALDQGKIPDDDMPKFIAGLAALKPQPQSLYCCSDLRLTANALRLNQAARHANMATMWEFDEHRTIHQGTDANGVDIRDLFENAADQVIAILLGAAPDSIDIYEPPPPPL